MTDPAQNPGFSPDVYSAQYHGSPQSGVEYGSQHQKPGAGPRMGSQPMYNQQNPGQQHHPPHLRPNGPGIIPNQQNPPLGASQRPTPINQPPSSATGPGQHYPQVPPQSSPNSMSGPGQVNGMTAYNQSPTQDNVASGAPHHMNGPHTAIPPRGPGVSQQPPAAFQQQMPGQQMQRQPLSYTQTLPQAQPSRPPISSSSTGMSASQPQGFPQQPRPPMASQPFPMGPSQTGPNMGQPQMQPPVGQPQSRPPMGMPPTRPPMGQSQTRPPMGQPQTRPPMGQPQTRPPMGQPPTRPPIGPPQPRDAVGVQQVRPPLGPPQAQPTEGLSPSGVPPSNQPVGLPPASSPPGAVHAGGFSTPSSTPQPTGGRPEELPVPYHGQAQYSHQVHGHSSLTPAGLTPGSGPPSQRSSRAPSPIPGNSYDALEGQFSGSPQAPSPGDPSGAMQSNVAAPPPQTGGITGRRHYPQMAGGYAGNQYATPPPPQVSGAQVNTGYPGMVPSSTAQYPQQPDMSQPGQMANSTAPAQQGLNASFSSMKIKGDALRPVNLLQERHIIPPDGVEQVRATLPQEFKNVNCNPDIFRCTLNSLPNTQSLLSKSRLPLGILIHPFKDLAQLPVIQSSVIVRCRTCRTYINPFVVFVDMRRWKCNLCYRVNELPEEFNYDPVSKTYGEPQRRPEIRSSTIEFIAPSEYMLRPPQPAVYLYVIDVSFNAIETGYLQVFCQVLLEELERIPGDSRTQIGFITFDRSLHFYNLAEGLSQPQQLIVSDVDEIFLPCPDNLLVNMNESKELVIDLLNKLPDMFKKTSETGSALGPALQAAYKLMSPTGGRVSVFQTHLPTVGAGSLKCREDPNERAGKKVQHLTPATDFYKKLSLDCSAQQIAVDLFMLNSQYADLATVAGIAKYSGGCLHYFPNFHTVSNPSEVERLEATLKRYFTRKIGFESVMRIRCTRGLSIHTFHGNFFVRSTDLLSLPNINPDAGFGMQMSIDDNLECNSVCFQAALLYTSSKGERRIRVHTLCLPVTNAISEIYAGADQQAIVGLLSKMAVDKTMIQSIGDARDAMLNAATDMLGAYGTTLTNSQRVGQLPAPYSLRLLPLYILALMKSTGFRVGSSTKLDDRVFHLEMCKTAPLTTFMPTLYPHLYPVHALDDNNALSKGEQVVPQPGLLQLSSANMDRHGAYILDTGSQIILWLAAAVSDRFCQEVLNKSNFQAVPEVMLELPEVENPTSERLRTFIAHLQEQHAHQASFLILREDSRSRMEFLKHLIEDRTESAYSYYEFLQHLQKEVKS